MTELHQIIKYYDVLRLHFVIEHVTLNYIFSGYPLFLLALKLCLFD